MARNSINQREEYVARINRVLDYIETNIDDDLSLDTLSKVADFSRFHFHRIFGAMVGETLNQFIQRIRVERAAWKLIDQPKRSITDIALDCGFSGSAAFSRAFKEAFNMTPSQWRQTKELAILQNSKICKKISNPGKSSGNTGKDLFKTSWYYDRETNQMKWRINMKDVKDKKDLEVNVEVKELPQMHVAYIRHIGPYKGKSDLFEGLFKKLMTWAGPRGLLNFPDTKCISIYHDNPDITDEDKLRLSVCITVPEDTEVDGEIGKMTIEGGKYGVAHIEIDMDQYEQAWSAVYGGWLPDSGYQPDDRYCFELYLNDPKEHPQHKHILDICIPVKPL